MSATDGAEPATKSAAVAAAAPAPETKENPDAATGGAPAKSEEAEPAPVERVYNKETGKWEEAGDGDDGEPATDKEGAMNKGKKPKEMAGFASLFRFASGLDIFLIILGALGAIGVGGALPAFSLLFGDLINDINNPDTTAAANAIEEISLTFLYVGIGMFGGGFLRVFGLMSSAKRQTHMFRTTYLKQMLRQDVGWHDTVQGKEFTSVLADASTKFEAGISVKFGEAMTYIAAFVVGIIIGFIKSWQLTLVILSLMPLAAILGAMFGKVMASAATAGAKSYAKAGGVAEESIASIRTVTALNGQGTAYAMYSKHLGEAQKEAVRSALNGGALFGVFNIFMYGAYALAFWYGSKLITDGTDGTDGQPLEGGTVLTVFFSVLFGAMMIGQAGPAIQSVQDAQAVAFEAYKVIDRVPDVDIEGTDGIEVDASCKGHLELRDVRFSYPSRPDAEVLKGVSFDVRPGTSVALVGGSGCGKSTCMALIQRFYEPTAGAVLLDGQDVRGLNVRSLRRHIGIVSQEPTLFATSIMDNIKYGAGADRTPSDEDVIEAAKSANIHDFITSLPQSYDTQVGDQGIQLSGGQKQRVAIARALLRNPTVLLLDEATSALDTQSERIVQAALDNLMEHRTTIMIAHRLSTVRKATQIIVMESGQIIERGSHDELAVKEDGVYAELARLQALHHQSAEEAGGIKALASEMDPELEAHMAAEREAAAAAAAEQLRAQKAPHEKTPEELAAERAATKEAAQAQQAKMASWNHKLMGMSFTNSCEWIKLVLACLMACVNGAVLPVFSIVFTEMLTLLFLCTPIPLGAPPSEETAGTIVEACQNATGAGFAPAIVYYGCAQQDLLDLTAMLPTYDDSLENFNAFGALCQQTVADCRFPSATCVADGCDASEVEAECNARLLIEAGEFSGWFVLIGVAACLGILFQLWLFGDIGAALTRRIREASFRSLLRQHIGFFDKEENSTGALTTKLAADAAVVEAAVGKNIGVYVQNGCTVVVALVIAFIAGWELTLLMLALMPFMIVGNIIETRAYMSETTKASADESRAGQIVSEAVRGVRTVSAFGIEPSILALYDRLTRRTYDTAVGLGACGGMAYGYSQFIMFAIYTCSFLFAGWLIREGMYTSDQVMRVFFVLLLSAFSIGQTIGLNADVAKGQKAIPSIFGLLEAKSEIDPTSDDGLQVSSPVATGVKGRIEFRNVKFAYPERKGLVLKGISFTVEPGQTVALVGGSGSGKSTSFALLERFYDLAEGNGEILLDGRPIQEYNIRTLRNIFGQVEQEPRLFGTTIRKNVLYGTRKEYQDLLAGTSRGGETATQPGTAVDTVADKVRDVEAAEESEREETDRRVTAALDAANASDFIATLPGGLDTPVGEQGKGQLSGGQKQRVAIGRALLRDAPIMLLDEATSALDSESEKLVQDALNRIMRERTTLVIAHRLSTIQDADKIVVMDKGVIVEEGTHQELLQHNGVYAELCREQSMATA